MIPVIGGTYRAGARSSAPFRVYYVLLENETYNDYIMYFGEIYRVHFEAVSWARVASEEGHRLLTVDQEKELYACIRCKTLQKIGDTCPCRK